MSKIKVLFCAHARFTGSQNRAPGSLSVCSPLYKGINILENACSHRVHRFENLCTRQPKCAHSVQGAPLFEAISNTEYHNPSCRVSGVPASRECSGKLQRSPILAVRRTLTGSRGEYLRVVGIHSDG